MVHASELSEFLQARRARATPEGRGLLTYAGRRRVAGLRREELAQLAGVSVSYYTSLEQGRAANASPEILRALARALDLDEFEEAHLLDLAETQRRRQTSRRRRSVERVEPHLCSLMDAIPWVPALVTGRRGDILAWNRLGHALFASNLSYHSVENADTRPNVARIVFLDPHSREFFVDWKAKAQAVVAHLRMSAGKHPEDAGFAELVGELSMKSADFAQFWAGHRVRPCGLMTMTLCHPTVGALTVTQQTLLSPTSEHQSVLIVTTESGSASETSLKMLGSLSADHGR